MIGRLALVFEDEGSGSPGTISVHPADALSTVLDCFNPAKALCRFIVDRTRSVELRKQIDAEKEAVDTFVEEEKKCISIKYEEYIKRLEEDSKVLEARLHTEVEQHRTITELKEMKLEEDSLLNSIKMDNTMHGNESLNRMMKGFNEIINDAMKDGYAKNCYFHELNEKYRQALRAQNILNKQAL